MGPRQRVRRRRGGASVEPSDLDDARPREHSSASALILGDIGVEELDHARLLLITRRFDYFGWPLVEHDAVSVPSHAPTLPRERWRSPR